ncbi:hypothetical protein ABZX92_24495 [Lentzea sp. NPDC006480]|uniref:hypothetical protein n=1 Tax=Lentzea sp. NPDC006480 TaxID=3157176 RepID=UPI0033AC2D0C
MELVLTVLGTGCPDHRFRTQGVRGANCDGVQIRAEAEFPGPVLDNKSTVLKRVRRRHPGVVQNLQITCNTEKCAGLEQFARFGCRKSDVPEGWPIGFFTCDEVPRPVVQVLVVNVPAVLGQECRSTAAVEQHTRPQFPDGLDYLIADNVVKRS